MFLRGRRRTNVQTHDTNRRPAPPEAEQLRSMLPTGAEGTIPAVINASCTSSVCADDHDLRPAEPLRAALGLGSGLGLKSGQGFRRSGSGCSRCPRLVSMSYSTRRPACSARTVALPTANHRACPSRGVRLLAGPETPQSSSEHSHPPCTARRSSMAPTDGAAPVAQSDSVRSQAGWVGCSATAIVGRECAQNCTVIH